MIGESANESIIKGIRNIAKQHKAIENLNEVLTMHMQPNYILANLSIEFNDYIKVETMKNLISKIEKEMKTLYPQVKRVYIKAETKLV